MGIRLQIQMDDKMTIRQSCETQLSITNYSQETNKIIDKFHNIQQKLERLTLMKATHKQVGSQQRIAGRLQVIEQKFKQQGSLIQQRIDLLRQMLIQMKISYQQREKQSNHRTIQRRNQIKQLKMQIEQVFQSQKRQGSLFEKGNIQKFCKDASNIQQSFLNQAQSTNQQISSMEYKFQHSLPRLHQRIAASNNYFVCKIKQTVKEMMEQSKNYEQLLRIEENHQEKSYKQIRQYISFAMDQIKEEIDNQRRQRRSMKQKLQFLILTASKRINLK